MHVRAAECRLEVRGDRARIPPPCPLPLPSPSRVRASLSRVKAFGTHLNARLLALYEMTDMEIGNSI
eukprot:6173202-Pleurochrysis_carterae.AAC.1